MSTTKVDPRCNAMYGDAWRKNNKRRRPASGVIVRHCRQPPRRPDPGGRVIFRTNLWSFLRSVPIRDDGPSSRRTTPQRVVPSGKSTFPLQLESTAAGDPSRAARAGPGVPARAHRDPFDPSRRRRHSPSSSTQTRRDERDNDDTGANCPSTCVPVDRHRRNRTAESWFNSGVSKGDFRLSASPGTVDRFTDR